LRAVFDEKIASIVQMIIKISGQMKKSKLIVIIGNLLMLSSCIDEGSNTIECAQNLGYITSVNNTVCAATSCGYVTSPEIQKLKQKECYVFGYTITSYAQNNVYLADRVYHISEQPLLQTSLVQETPPVLTENNIAINNLSIPIFWSTSYMGDRWLFNFSALSKDKSKVTAHFYYDKNNQIDKEGKNVKEENKVIIDVVFIHSESTEDNSVAKMRNFSSIGNLESLRAFPNFNKVTTDPNGKMYATLLIQFRFHKYISKDKSEISYLGVWNKVNSCYERVYYLTEAYFTTNQNNQN